MHLCSLAKCLESSELSHDIVSFGHSHFYLDTVLMIGI